MTVKQLIEHLQKYDPDSDVHIVDASDVIRDLTTVEGMEYEVRKSTVVLWAGNVSAT
jgi:hypothetical protein